MLLQVFPDPSCLLSLDNRAICQTHRDKGARGRPHLLGDEGRAFTMPGLLSELSVLPEPSPGRWCGSKAMATLVLSLGFVGPFSSQVLTCNFLPSPYVSRP